jgi:hypothetical protein
MRLAALLTGGALAALIATTPAEAAARVGVAIVVGQEDHAYRYGAYRQGLRDGGPNTWRVGYNSGYEDGAHHGQRDGEHGEDFDYRHDKRYRRADNRYRPSCGPIYVFRAGYREGYERGYREAYAASHRHCRRDHDHKRYDHGYRQDPRWPDRDGDGNADDWQR